MDFRQIITGRHSARGYEDKPVTKEIMEQLVLAAQSAPSAGNLQPWHFYAVMEKEQVTVLMQHSLLNPPSWHRQIPACIVVTALPDVSGQRYHQRGGELYCIQDTAAAVQNILLSATGLGLGSCWIGAFDEEKCAAFLGLPKSQRPVAIVAVGYSNTEPSPAPRKPLQDILTWVE